MKWKPVVVCAAYLLAVTLGGIVGEGYARLGSEDLGGLAAEVARPNQVPGLARDGEESQPLLPGPVLPQLAVVVDHGEPTPTPEPVVVVEAYTVTPIEVWSEDQMRELLTGAGCIDECQEQSLRVAYCESGYNRYATGWAAGERGFWQIHPVHPEWEDAYDPAVNVAAMMRISQGGTNWWAWTCKP